MTFTTLTFLLFLTAIFAAYWLAKRQELQNCILLSSSYLFYGWWEPSFCALMLFASTVDYLVGLGMLRSRSQRVRGVLLACSIAVNLGTLAYFKYFNFFADSLQALGRSLGWQFDPVTVQVLLPVGISFYTFQTMSYSIDVYRGQTTPTRNYLEYLAFISFFPQLVAGPIERSGNLLAQFQRARVFHYAEAADGARQFLWGFFKKLVVADRLCVIVDNIYSRLDQATGPEVVLGTIAFAFQIYCDFSAYSDMAIGLARLFGFNLMRNFAYPYFSQDVGEFWRRWHISLSTWFRDYVYVPLGGSRRGKRVQLRNLVLTFMISGLWHGASWNFVVWGTLMGLGTAYATLRSTREPDVPPPGDSQRLLPAPRAILSMSLTFTFICFGWVFFRASTLSQAVLAIRSIINDCFTFEAYVTAIKVVQKPQAILGLGTLTALVATEWFRRHHQHPLAALSIPKWQRWTVYTGLLWGALLLAAPTPAQFIYFQF